MNTIWILISVFVLILAVICIILGIRSFSMAKEKEKEFTEVQLTYTQNGWVETGNFRVKNSYNRGKPYGN